MSGRRWIHNDTECRMTCSADEGFEVEVMDVSEPEKWSKDEPIEAGWYWAWNGKRKMPAIPIRVEYSGEQGCCYVPGGQHGWVRSQSLSEFPGCWWLKIDIPELPEVAD